MQLTIHKYTANREVLTCITLTPYITGIFYCLLYLIYILIRNMETESTSGSSELYNANKQMSLDWRSSNIN